MRAHGQPPGEEPPAAPVLPVGPELLARLAKLSDPATAAPAVVRQAAGLMQQAASDGRLVATAAAALLDALECKCETLSASAALQAGRSSSLRVLFRFADEFLHPLLVLRRATSDLNNPLIFDAETQLLPVHAITHHPNHFRLLVHHLLLHKHQLQGPALELANYFYAGNQSGVEGHGQGSDAVIEEGNRTTKSFVHSADSHGAWQSAHAEAGKGTAARSTLEAELGLRQSVQAMRRQRVHRTMLPDIASVSAAVLQRLNLRGLTDKPANLDGAPLTAAALSLFDTGRALIKKFHSGFVAKGLHGFEQGAFPSDFLPVLTLADEKKAEAKARNRSRDSDGKSAAKRQRLEDEEGESEEDAGDEGDEEEEDSCQDYEFRRALLVSAGMARRAAQTHEQ